MVMISLKKYSQKSHDLNTSFNFLLLRTSKQCNATRHCIQSDWEYRSVPMDNSPTCQICKNIIKESRNMLPCDKREVELWKIFETTCKMIPSKRASEECIKTVINNFNEYLELLSSQMSYEVNLLTTNMCIHNLKFILLIFLHYTANLHCYEIVQ